jgi:hypothetical protein
LAGFRTHEVGFELATRRAAIAAPCVPIVALFGTGLTSISAHLPELARFTYDATGIAIFDALAVGCAPVALFGIAVVATLFLVELAISARRNFLVLKHFTFGEETSAGIADAGRLSFRLVLFVVVFLIVIVVIV